MEPAFDIYSLLLLLLTIYDHIEIKYKKVPAFSAGHAPSDIYPRMQPAPISKNFK